MNKETIKGIREYYGFPPEGYTNKDVEIITTGSFGEAVVNLRIAVQNLKKAILINPLKGEKKK